MLLINLFYTGQAFNKVGLNLRSNEMFITLGLYLNPSFTINYLSPELKKIFGRLAVTLDPMSLRSLQDDNIIYDENIILEAIRRNPLAYEYAADIVQKMDKVILTFLQNSIFCSIKQIFNFSRLYNERAKKILVEKIKENKNLLDVISDKNIKEYIEGFL